MIRQFVTFMEAVERLSAVQPGLTYEGLRQGFALGLGSKLPAFIYSDSTPFLATLTYAKRKGDWHYATSGGLQVTDAFMAGAAEGSGRYIDIADLGDSYCDIEFPYPELPDDGRAYVILRGFFRVRPWDMREAARSGPSMISVAPSKWWSDESPWPRGENGTPRQWLQLEPFNSARFLDCNELADLWFRETDLSALCASFAAESTASPSSVSAPAANEDLDPRERTTAHRLIAALAAMAKIPDRGAAGAIELQLQRMGFDGPKEAAIKKWLHNARSMPPDRNSE
jgi:hypothetical protein